MRFKLALMSIIFQVMKLEANNEMSSEFFIAAPGGDFKSYFKGIVKKDPAARKK
jgi:hypothetical protein